MASDDHRLLIDNAAVTGAAQGWNGGRGTFVVEGTVGGATIKLQWSRTGTGTWHDVGADVTLTAAGIAGFEVAPGFLRALVAGGTPSALYVYAIGSRVD